MAKKTFEWFGHVLAALIVLYSIFYGGAAERIIVSLLLGACYLGRVYLTQSSACLYSTVFLFSFSYLLLIELFFGVQNLIIFWLPPFFLLQLCGPDPLHTSKLADETESETEAEISRSANPLAVSSRIVSAVLVCFILFSGETITGSVFLTVPLLCLGVYEVRVAFSRNSSWHLFFASALFSAAYYFYLLQTIRAPLNLVMAFWAGFGLLCLLSAFIFSKKERPIASGLFAASFVMATVAITVVMVGSLLENRIAPLEPQATGIAQENLVVNAPPVSPEPLSEATASHLQPGPPNPAANVGGIVVFFAAAIVFTLLRVKYDRNEFVFMLLLTLGLSAYFMVVLIEDPLYRSFINYALYGLLVLGLLFLYVLVKDFFNISWSLADFLSEHHSRILYAFIPVALLLGYFLFDYAMAVTENSHFCGSCHIMKVQFDTWKRDKHSEKGVGCFDCHYSPGFMNFVKGRTSGAVMVVKNFTGLYGTKFPATVSDESCKKCHMDGILKDTEKLESWITYKDNIKFNHKVMVHQEVSGIELKCTSCHTHYRSLEKAHLSVPEGVCYTCHFMNRNEETGTAIGNCYTCHYLKDIEHDLGTLVTIGDGEVTKDQCLQCHWDAKKFDNASYQHRKHITDYHDFTKPGISCFDCHDRIEHGDVRKLVSASQ